MKLKTKKLMFILMLVIASLFIIFQTSVYVSTNGTEGYTYVVEKTLENNVEIRTYNDALFARVQLSEDNFKNMSYKGFRILAGYIFGGNEQNQKIAMTSPVLMEMNEVKTMEFMVPKGYKKEDLPIPNDKSIEFIERKTWKAASITFGGFTNTTENEAMKNVLIETLRKLNIEHKNNFKYLGYNPPYQLFGRRNEIVVELL